MFKYLYQMVRVLPLAFLVMGIQSCTEESLTADLVPAATEQLSTPESSEELYINFEAGLDKEELSSGGEVELRTRTRSYYRFRTLNQALRCTGLNAALFDGENTIYAPSDAAFAKLGLNEHNICEELDAETLTAILLYHVSAGTVSRRERGCVELLNGDIAQVSVRNHRLLINDSRIYYSFRQRGRGYSLRVYIIDEVLMPPSSTIAEVAGETSKFSVLLDAVLAADPSVAALLSDPDAVVTVFAPTNEAFIDLLGALNLGSLEELIEAIGIDGLTTVLAYHVVDACAFSNDLEDGLEITTLQGESITVDLDNLQLQDASDVPAGLVGDCLDVLTANGIVHTIDKVLLPEEILMGL